MTQNKYKPKTRDSLSHAATTQARSAPRILLVEDDDEMRRLLAQSFYSVGYEVTQCRNGIEFLRCLNPFILGKGKLDYKLIISDILMPGLTGLEILEDLHDCRGFPPMILITAFGDKNTHEKAKRLGVAAMFDKPFEIEDLLYSVCKIIPSSAV